MWCLWCVTLVFFCVFFFVFFVFFFNDTATTEIYTLSLHDALPIYMIQYATGSPSQFLFMYCRVVWPTPTTLLQNHNKLNFEFIILILCCERIPDKTFRWMAHNNKHCNKFSRNRHLPSVSISEMFTRNGKYASWPEKFSITQVKKVTVCQAFCSREMMMAITSQKMDNILRFWMKNCFVIETM